MNPISSINKVRLSALPRSGIGAAELVVAEYYPLTPKPKLAHNEYCEYSETRAS